MAFQQIQGDGLWLASMHDFGLSAIASNGGFMTSAVIDATGEKFAVMGRVWFPGRTGTKDIRRICFRFGTVTKAGGSALTLSLQNASTASGPPGQPDETQDETVAIANADASFASNTWYRSGVLSADRTVAYGELLAIVWEYDGGGRLGADTVMISTSPSHNLFVGDNNVSLKTGGSWANQSALPNAILEFSDGTFGRLQGSFPAKAFNNHSLNTGSTPDEYAMPFTVPYACKVDAIAARLRIDAANCDFDLVLYEGTTALQSASFDATQTRAAGFSQWDFAGLIPETELEPGTQYYVAVKPTTANSVSVYSIDVDDANHFTTWPGGTPLTLTTRTDGGAWAAVTATRRLLADVRVSALDDAVGGGGTTIAGTTMLRGMVG